MLKTFRIEQKPNQLIFHDNLMTINGKMSVNEDIVTLNKAPHHKQKLSMFCALRQNCKHFFETKIM